MTLRPWASEDVDALVAFLDGEDEIVRWLDAIPQPYPEAEANSWIEQASAGWRDETSAQFAVTDTTSGELVGSVGVGWVGEREERVSEVGYWTRWAMRELGCERLQLRADTDNVPSLRVAEKTGFTREGVLRSVHFNPRLGRRVDFVMFSLLPGELD